MHAAHSYFSSSQQNTTRISTLRLRNAAFLSEKPRLSALTPPTATKSSIMTHSQSAEVAAVVRWPRKTDDLMAMQRVVVKEECTNVGVEANEEKGELRRERAVRLEKFFQRVVDKAYLGCLLRSIGAVSESTYEQKAQNVSSVWLAVSKLPAQDKIEQLFGLLIYKLSKNVFGKAFKSNIPVSHYLSVLEGLVSSTSSATDFIQIMASQHEDNPDSAPEFTLNRQFVDTLKSQIRFLVEELAERGNLVSGLDSIFFSEQELDRVKAKVITKHLYQILVTLKNTIISLSMSEPGFDKVFKETLNNNLPESSTTESVRRVLNLITFYGRARTAYTAQLTTAVHIAAVTSACSTHVSTMLQALPRYYRMASLLDKKSLHALERIVTDNRN